MKQGWHMAPGEFIGHWFDEDGWALCKPLRRAARAPVSDVRRFNADDDCRTCWRLLKVLDKAADDIAKGALA